MRSDAVKRREAIVDAARGKFASEGREVALEAIAEAAGVGIATLYRNFPSRSELADEVALTILREMQDAAVIAARGMTKTPREAWEGYVQRLVELNLGALTAALAGYINHGLASPVREAQTATLEGVAALLDEAKGAGLVREGFGALELVLAIGMLTRPQPEAIQAAAPRLVPQLVEVLLAGLRPPS
jgi:AcrR family transcriptional regulator